MPAWAWVLLVLTAFGVVLWRVEDVTGFEVTERLGKALAILLILAFLGSLIVGFANMAWE